MASTLDLLRLLSHHHVEFVIVGGVAAVLHGSQFVTEDLEVCVPLTEENLARLVVALHEARPRFRMHPDRPELPPEAGSLIGYKNLYLETELGQIDILSEILGVGTYEQVAEHSIRVDLGGVSCRVLDLDTLIVSKKALNQEKDRLAVLELQAIQERIRRSGDPGKR